MVALGGAGANHGRDSTVADEGPLKAGPLWLLQQGSVLTVNTLEGTHQEKEEKYSEFHS